MSNLNGEIDKFFEDGMREACEHLKQMGEKAVQLNKEEGNYHNKTGRLRNSNYYEMTDDGMVIGNRADYASSVESKGYNVIDSGMKFLMEEL